MRRPLWLMVVPVILVLFGLTDLIGIPFWLHNGDAKGLFESQSRSHGALYAVINIWVAMAWGLLQGLLRVVAGNGLLRLRPWARPLTMALCICGMLWAATVNGLKAVYDVPIQVLIATDPIGKSPGAYYAMLAFGTLIWLLLYGWLIALVTAPRTVELFEHGGIEPTDLTNR